LQKKRRPAYAKRRYGADDGIRTLKNNVSKRQKLRIFTAKNTYFYKICKTADTCFDTYFFTQFSPCEYYATPCLITSAALRAAAQGVAALTAKIALKGIPTRRFRAKSLAKFGAHSRCSFFQKVVLCCF